jgi:hypothetical protein
VHPINVKGGNTIRLKLKKGILKGMGDKRTLKTLNQRGYVVKREGMREETDVTLPCSQTIEATDQVEIAGSLFPKEMHRTPLHVDACHSL